MITTLLKGIDEFKNMDKEEFAWYIKDRIADYIEEYRRSYGGSSVGLEVVFAHRRSKQVITDRRDA